MAEAWIDGYDKHETDFFPPIPKHIKEMPAHDGWGINPWTGKPERWPEKTRQEREAKMGRYASEPGNTFEQAPADTHVARCIKLIDLGTQRGEYQGQPTVRNQVMITWELPQALMTKGEASGKPFIVSAFLTNSLGEKAKLRGWLEAWRGKEFTAAELKKFDLQNILGVPCLVTVIHNEKGKAVVQGVTKLPNGFDCPKQVNKSVAFWLDQFSEEAFNALPEGIKNIIAQSDEYKALRHGGSDPARHFDDLPSGLPEEEAVPF